MEVPTVLIQSCQPDKRRNRKKTYLLLVKNSWNKAKEWAPSVIVVVVSSNIKILWQTIKDILWATGRCSKSPEDKGTLLSPSKDYYNIIINIIIIIIIKLVFKYFRKISIAPEYSLLFQSNFFRGHLEEFWQWIIDI